MWPSQLQKQFVNHFPFPYFKITAFDVVMFTLKNLFHDGFELSTIYVYISTNPELFCPCVVLNSHLLWAYFSEYLSIEDLGTQSLLFEVDLFRHLSDTLLFLVDYSVIKWVTLWYGESCFRIFDTENPYLNWRETWDALKFILNFFTRPFSRADHNIGVFLIWTLALRFKIFQTRSVKVSMSPEPLGACKIYFSCIE